MPHHHPLHIQAPVSAPLPGPAAPVRPDGRARLAICLPTYNRCELLAKSLAELISVVGPHRIPIHVSDNHSDDATGAVVQSLQARYDLLHYSRCDAPMPVDDHFRRVLALPSAEYCWLFGDHYRIVGSRELDTLLACLDDGFDFIVLNAEERVFGIPTQTFTQQEEVLRLLGWHMTMMTSLVYRADLLEKMNFCRFRGTHFIQTLSIFEYLDGADFRLRWLSDVIVGAVREAAPNNWQPRALDIFVRSWFVGIMSLPPGYGYEAKVRALRAHTDNTLLFSFKNLLHLRSLGAITFRRARAYARELPYVFDRRRIVFLYLLLLLPVAFVRALKKAVRAARSTLGRRPDEA